MGLRTNFPTKKKHTKQSQIAKLSKRELKKIAKKQRKGKRTSANTTTVDLPTTSGSNVGVIDGRPMSKKRQRKIEKVVRREQKDASRMEIEPIEAKPDKAPSPPITATEVITTVTKGKKKKRSKRKVEDEIDDMEVE